jgi:membrane protein DedA with SNARE-associated domain
VVLTAIASAVLGDNVAYWVGRRYGRLALTRFLKIGPERIERMQGLVQRYGMLAVFVGRFVAGLRFMAGPLAGSTGLGPVRFFVANLLGAIIYVPIAVGAGYAVGYGLGDRIEGLRRFTGGAEHVLLAAIVVAALGLWLWRARRARAQPRA